MHEDNLNLYSRLARNQLRKYFDHLRIKFKIIPELQISNAKSFELKFTGLDNYTQRQ